MKTLTAFSIAVGCAVLLSGVSASAADVPALRNYLEFQPSMFEFTDSFAGARSTLTDQGYIGTSYRHDEPTAYTTATLAQFRTTTNFLNGIYLHASHGYLSSENLNFGTTAAVLGLEEQPPTPEGLDAAVAHAAYYVQIGYVSADDLSVIAAIDIYGTNWGYVLAVTEAGLDQLVTISPSFAFSPSCFSTATKGGWGAEMFVGYSYLVDNLSVVIPNEQTFWDCMNGEYGWPARHVSTATAYTSLSYDGSTTFQTAPRIDGYYPAAPYTVVGWTDGQMRFSTEMDTSIDPTAFLSTTGTLRLSDASWLDTRLIGYKLTVESPGDGALVITSKECKTTGGIWLDPNGVGPSGETHTIPYTLRSGTPAQLGLSEVSVVENESGAEIVFTTVWEDQSDSLFVDRLDGAGVLLARIPAGPAQLTGAGNKYSVSDPQGTVANSYRIFETQVPPRGSLMYGPFEVGPPESTPAPPPNPDSLETLLAAMGYSCDNSPGIPPNPPVPPPVYALVCPDIFVESLCAYAEVWTQRGVPTRPVGTSEMAVQGGVREWLQWAYSQGTRYALLVGDASERDWYIDPSKWVPYGWYFDGPPRVVHSRPDSILNILPTFYFMDTEAPQNTMTYWRPYYASDLPYADVDNDGLPEMIIGRLPASTTAEILLYTLKLQAYLAGASPPEESNVELITMAFDDSTVLSDLTFEAGDRLASVVPTAQLTRISPPAPPIYSPNAWRMVVNGTTTSNKDVIAFVSAISSEQYYANSWDHSAWDVSQLQSVSNGGRFFVAGGFSCGMGGFDLLNGTGGKVPVCEALLFAHDRGAIAAIGPTRASWQNGNGVFGAALLEEVMRGLGQSYGSTFMVAQRKSIVKHPGLAELFRSYVFLGDPVVGGEGIVTAVNGADASSTDFTFSVEGANPANPSISFAFTLGRRSSADVRVFDVGGRLIKRLVSVESGVIGRYRAEWDGRDQSGHSVGSGIYFVQLVAGDYRKTLKAAILK